MVLFGCLWLMVAVGVDGGVLGVVECGEGCVGWVPPCAVGEGDVVLLCVV